MRFALLPLVLLAGLGCRGGEGLLDAKAGWDGAAKRAYNEAWEARTSERPSEKHGRGRKGKGDAGVYVDGRYTGALRFQELPPSLRTTWFPMQDGRKSRRFTFADYLAALGVDLRAVQAVHLHGGRARVTMIDGDELRRTAAGLHIAFTKGDGGDPQFRYPGVDLHTNTAVDKIGAMAVYVEKAPPVRQHGQLVLDGQVLTGLAYGAQAPKGTRVYFDGRFVGALRHRDASEGELEAQLAALGVPGRSIADVRFVARDEIALAQSERVDAIVVSSHARKTDMPPGKLAGADLTKRPLGG